MRRRYGLLVRLVTALSDNMHPATHSLRAIVEHSLKEYCAERGGVLFVGAPGHLVNIPPGQNTDTNELDSEAAQSTSR